MSSTATYVPLIKAPTTINSTHNATDHESVASGSDSAPERYQCCVCELHDWVFVGFGMNETCFRCDHAVCDWCVVYTRVTEVLMGA